MTKGDTLSKIIKIPIVMLIAIVILIVCIMAGVLGKKLIANAAKYEVANAASSEDGNFEYTINEDGETITITQYRGTEENLVIPSEIDGYSVTGLGDGSYRESEHATYSVFYYGYCIETIKLPVTMEKIDAYTFLGCKNLINIELNEGLKIIEDQALFGCKKLKELNIPSTVQALTADDLLNPFYGCISLESITVNSNNQYYSSSDGVLFNKDKTALISYPSAKKELFYSIPESTKQIYGEAIYNLNLENLYISKNVRKMGGSSNYSWSRDVGAIVGCSNLKNISVDGSNEIFSSEDGVLFNKAKTELLTYPSGKQDKEYIIPSKVQISDTINNLYLEKITINSLIYNISVFRNLINLKDIEIDSENTDFMSKDGVVFNKTGDMLVYYPSGKTDDTYTIDNSVTKIQSAAFENAKIKQIFIPEKVTNMGIKTFYNCSNLESVVMANNITSIGSSAFYNCVNLKNVIISNNTTSIGNYAFYNCVNLKNVIIPNNTTLIGDYAFYNCSSITSITIPKNVTQIGKNAFYNCSNIEELYIPEGITKINAFDGMSKLRIINIPSTVSDIPANSFDSTYTRAQIISINHENPTISGVWAFSNPDMGTTIIRCNSTATNVINWVNSHGYFSYNLMDLGENDIKFLYTIEKNNEVTINKYIGDEEIVEIPSEIEGYPVTKVISVEGTYKSLIIPSTVKNIGAIYSSNLENISVDDNSLYFTSKDGVLFNKSENELLYYPMGRKEISYDIPEGTTHIGGTTSVTDGVIRYKCAAFSGSIYLENLNIPKSVSKIDTGTLSIESLRKISLDPVNEKYIVKDNILYVINNNGLDIVTVPTKLEGNIELLYGLTKIETYEFKNIKNLECVIIPTTITSISHNAFYHCENLKKIVISPNTKLTEINAANLSFGQASSQLIVYCEENSDAYKHVRKWGIDYEIIKPIKIEIAKLPDKLEYEKDEEILNLEGGLITITYDDGTLLDLAMTSNLLNIIGFDTSTFGNKTIEVDYKGNKANFIINITGEEEQDTTITSTKYEITEEYVTKISSETKLANFKESLSIANETTISVLNRDNEPLAEDSMVATGMTLVIKSGENTKTLKLIITGDTTGDGVADFKDIVAINKHRLNQKLLGGEYLMAGEVTGDEKVDFKDIVKINKFRLNKIIELF